MTDNRKRIGLAVDTDEVRHVRTGITCETTGQKDATRGLDADDRIRRRTTRRAGARLECRVERAIAVHSRKVIPDFSLDRSKRSANENLAIGLRLHRSDGGIERDVRARVEGEIDSPVGV